MDNTTCKCGNIKQKLIDTILFGKQILLNPTTIFRNMERQGGYTDPLLFMTTIGLIAGILRVLVTFCYMANGVKIGLFSALSAIIVMPIIVVVIGYIGAFLLSVIMRVIGGDDNLETALRVTSYLAIISPIAVIVLPIPYVGNLLIFGILTYLLVAAAIEVYQLSSNTAWLVFGISIGSLALLSLGSEIVTRHTTPQPQQQVITCPVTGQQSHGH
ncbi:MAG: hypothetical protein B6I36_03720 [Desulfobacteraceae bacterium 4572_35.1]|nr:MAG: hypothetical protein B6I36_03720 [Desulfobacteraceae bacterium 4572_35.1]